MQPKAELCWPSPLRSLMAPVLTCDLRDVPYLTASSAATLAIMTVRLLRLLRLFRLLSLPGNRKGPQSTWLLRYIHLPAYSWPDIMARLMTRLHGFPLPFHSCQMHPLLRVSVLFWAGLLMPRPYPGPYLSPTPRHLVDRPPRTALLPIAVLSIAPPETHAIRPSYTLSRTRW